MPIAVSASESHPQLKPCFIGTRLDVSKNSAFTDYSVIKARK